MVDEATISLIYQVISEMEGRNSRTVREVMSRAVPDGGAFEAVGWAFIAFAIVFGSWIIGWIVQKLLMTCRYAGNNGWESKRKPRSNGFHVFATIVWLLILSAGVWASFFVSADFSSLVRASGAVTVGGAIILSHLFKPILLGLYLQSMNYWKVGSYVEINGRDSGLVTSMGMFAMVFQSVDRRGKPAGPKTFIGWERVNNSIIRFDDKPFGRMTMNKKGVPGSKKVAIDVSEVMALSHNMAEIDSEYTLV